MSRLIAATLNALSDSSLAVNDAEVQQLIGDYFDYIDYGRRHNYYDIHAIGP